MSLKCSCARTSEASPLLHLVYGTERTSATCRHSCLWHAGADAAWELNTRRDGQRLFPYEMCVVCCSNATTTHTYMNKIHILQSTCAIRPNYAQLYYTIYEYELLARYSATLEKDNRKEQCEWVWKKYRMDFSTRVCVCVFRWVGAHGIAVFRFLSPQSVSISGWGQWRCCCSSW